MGKLFIPKVSHTAAGGDHGSRVLPLPQRIGICLDYDAGRVFFYDADSMRCLYERQVDCSGIMYPAFGLMGGGAIHLEEFIIAKRLSYMWTCLIWSAVTTCPFLLAYFIPGFSHVVICSYLWKHTFGALFLVTWKNPWFSAF